MFENYLRTGEAPQTEGPWQYSGRYSEITATARIDPFSCLPCGACLAACPRGAVDYGKSKPMFPHPLDSAGSAKPGGPGLRSGH
jgi:ferredoxin